MELGENILGFSWTRASYLLKGTVLTLVLSVGAACFADTSDQGERMDNQLTNQLNAVRHFDIDAQELPAALLQFGEQAELTVMVHQDASGNTPGLQGEYTTDEALQQLLAGTGLEYRIKGEAIIVTRLVAELMPDPRTTKPPLLKRLGTAIATAIFATSGAAAIAADDATADSNEAVIEEIVVTATRRETSLQDTALALTVFTTEDIALQGIENFSDIAIGTPSVVAQNFGHFQKYAVRGINTTSSISSTGNQRSVHVYYDDVPITSGSVVTPDLRLYDIERVEVLRGPQGTSFGAGAMAGALRVITKKANLDGFDASVRVDFASTKDGGVRQRYNGMVNIPISDTLALRAVGSVVDDEGYIDNIGFLNLAGGRNDGSSNEPRNENRGIRASLRWEPSDNLAGTLSVMNDDVDGNTWPGTQDPSLGRNKRASLDEALFVEATLINATVEIETEWASLISSTTYATNDHGWDIELYNIFGDTFPFAYGETQEHDYLTQELRLVSNSEGPVEWLAGFYYLNREMNAAGAIWTEPAYLDSVGIDYSALPCVKQFNDSHCREGHPGGVDLDPNVKLIYDREVAIFGELTYHLTDTLSLTAGLRYTEFEYTDNLTQQGGFSDALDLMIAGTPGVATYTPDTASTSGTGNQNSTTSKIGLNWRPNDAHTIYFTAAQGFRRPHPNVISTVIDIPASDPQFIPEFADSDELWSYELGAKSRFLDGRLQANLAVYFIDWKGIQVGANRTSDNHPYLLNAGNAEGKGFEAELLAWPSDNLELGLNLTFAETEIASLSQLEAEVSGYVQGARLPGPETKVSGFAQYTWGLNNGSSLYARADIQSVGDYPNVAPNIPGSATQAPNPLFEYTDSYDNVNAQIGWQRDKLSVVLYGENILDNDDSIVKAPDGAVPNRYGTLRPRTFGLRLDWKY